MCNKRVLSLFVKDMKHVGIVQCMAPLMILLCVVLQIIVFQNYDTNLERFEILNPLISLFIPLGGICCPLAMLQRYMNSPDDGLYDMYQSNRQYLIIFYLGGYLIVVAIVFIYFFSVSEQLGKRYGIIAIITMICAEIAYWMANLFNTAIVPAAIIVLYHIYACMIYDGEFNDFIWFYNDCNSGFVLKKTIPVLMLLAVILRIGCYLIKHRK